MTSISTGLHGVDQRLLQNYQRNNDRTQTSLERLSTGKRINHPSDDPPGFIAAEGLRKDLSDLKQKLGDIATERAQSHIQQSGLSEIQDALNDLRGQIVAAADGTLTADQRTTLETEIDETAKAIDRIAKLTGNKASPSLDTSTAALVQQSRRCPSGRRRIAIRHQSARYVSRRRTRQPRHLPATHQDQIAITSEALSNIEDTDFAAEASNLVQSQVTLPKRHGRDGLQQPPKRQPANATPRLNRLTRSKSLKKFWPPRRFARSCRGCTRAAPLCLFLYFALQFGQLCIQIGLVIQFEFIFQIVCRRIHSAKFRHRLGFGFALLNTISQSLELRKRVVVQIRRCLTADGLHLLAKIGCPLPGRQRGQAPLRFCQFDFHRFELPLQRTRSVARGAELIL